MNRALYIVGIVFAVIFMFVTAYYAEEVRSANWSSWDYSYSSYDSYNYSTYDSYSYDNSDDLTMEAGFWSLFFFVSFIAIDILGLVKVKTKTMKVFGILGLCFSGIFLLWNFLVIFDPGSISFVEVSPAWILYCLLMLAFSIVGLIQSVRYFKKQRLGIVSATNNTAPTSGGRDLLDN